MTASRDSSQDPIDKLLPDAVRELVYNYYEETPCNKCVLLELPPDVESFDQLLKNQGIDGVSAAYIYTPEDKEAEKSQHRLFYVSDLGKSPFDKIKPIDLSPSLLDQFYREFKPTSQAGVLTNQQLNRIHYLTRHQHQTRDPYNKTFSFFNNIQSERLRKAADDILRGSSDDNPVCIAIVKSDPSLLHEVIDATDTCGRKVRGTLLQIAAMAGDLDLCVKLIEAAKLPLEEAMQQLGVMGSPAAVAANEARNKRALDAVIKFTNDFVLAIERDKENKNDDEFKRQIDYILPSQLQAALTPDLTEVITSGYIFDPYILIDAIDWFLEENIACFWGEERFYNERWCINVIGKLQTLLSARDAQFFHGGINHWLWEEGLKRTSVSAEQSKGLGEVFFLAGFGRRSSADKIDLGLMKSAIVALLKNKVTTAASRIKPKDSSNEASCSHQARPRS